MRRAAIVLALLAFGVAGFFGREYLGPQLPPLPATSALHVERAVLEYVAERYPSAPLGELLPWPRALLAEAQALGWDHCLLLAIAEIESGFRSDRKGKHGEIGIFQVLPPTAKFFADVTKEQLAEPATNTRIAGAYLQDITKRKGALRDVLAEWNGGPRASTPAYYRLIAGAYIDILDRESLRCRYSRRERLVTLFHDDIRRVTP